VAAVETESVIVVAILFNVPVHFTLTLSK